MGSMCDGALFIMSAGKSKARTITGIGVMFCSGAHGENASRADDGENLCSGNDRFEAAPVFKKGQVRFTYFMWLCGLSFRFNNDKCTP